MSEAPMRDVPKGAIIGAGALIAFTIVLALVGRTTGLGAFVTPVGQAVEVRDLRFEDRVDGAVLVRADPGDRVVDVIAPGTNHFLRTTLRGLVRERKRERIGADQPFRLTRLANGRLRLEDPATRRRIDLDAFGRSNALAFSVIMEAAGRSERGG